MDLRFKVKEVGVQSFYHMGGCTFSRVCTNRRNAQKHGTCRGKPNTYKGFLFLCFVFVQKYYGRKSPTGRDVCRLRKAYYNARHEASAQIDEIVGETASEADSSETSVCEKENGHEKDEDVIRCICGLYKDEGLMIQCEKCMVRQGNTKWSSFSIHYNQWNFYQQPLHH